MIDDLTPHRALGRAQFTTYNFATGALGQFHDVPLAWVDLNTPAGHGRITGQHDPQTHYAPDGIITAKQVMAPIVSGLTVSNLPVPCIALILPGGHELVVDDGSLELDADYPGPYRIWFRAVSHLDCWVTVE